MFQYLKYTTLKPFKHTTPGSGFVKLSKGDFYVRAEFPAVFSSCAAFLYF